MNHCILLEENEAFMDYVEITENEQAELSFKKMSYAKKEKLCFLIGDEITLGKEGVVLLREACNQFLDEVADCSEKSYKIFVENEENEQEAVIVQAPTPEKAVEQLVTIPFIEDFSKRIVVEEFPEFDSNAMVSFVCKQGVGSKVWPEFYCRNNIPAEGLVMCVNIFVEILARYMQISVNEVLNMVQELANE